MQNNKLVQFFLLTLFAFFINIHTANASSQGDPVSLLQYIANNMIDGLKTNQATLKSKPQIVYRLAYEYVVPHADLSAMSKRVLPPAVWNSATPAQRKQFQEAFTKTLIRTYASALTSYKDQTIHFFPARGFEGNTVEVNSEINSSENEPIHVSYRMIKSGGGWRLYDISVEGVSMLDSFRAQFEDILSQGSMTLLLQRMASHNRR